MYPPGYQPPPGYAHPPGHHPYPYRPPGSIKVLGILNLVFSGLGAIGLMFTYGVHFGNLALGPRNPVIEIAHSSPEYMSFLRWSMIVGALGIIAFAASGIGLLKTRVWGRKLALAYGVYGILSSIIGLVATQHYVLGPLSRSLDRAANAGIMGGYMGGILGTVYPAILIAFMMKANVRAHFNLVAGPQLPPARVL